MDRWTKADPTVVIGGWLMPTGRVLQLSSNDPLQVVEGECGSGSERTMHKHTKDEAVSSLPLSPVTNCKFNSVVGRS
jgi:hypothetical protein